MMKPLIFTISAAWDDEAAVWSGHCDDIQGRQSYADRAKPECRPAAVRKGATRPNRADPLLVSLLITGKETSGAPRT
jgi:hypothetical protein